MLGIFLDLETTGLDASKHHIIEIALKVLDLRTDEVVGKFHAVVNQPRKIWDKRDPRSVEVNGFQWNEIEKGLPLGQIRKEVTELLNNLGVKRGKAVFICQNPAFDRGFFAHIVDVYTHESYKWPYHWLDLASMFLIFYFREQKKQGNQLPEELNVSKDNIAHHFGLSPEEQPHRAMNGVDHLITCYRAVLSAKED